MYEDKKEFHLNTIWYTANGDDFQALMRREFWIEVGQPDIARDKWSLYTEKWESHRKETVVTPWVIVHRDIGEPKTTFKVEERFWKRAQ